MRFNRDRAILALTISTAARANELLGMSAADGDWGDQLIPVRRKTDARVSVAPAAAYISAAVSSVSAGSWCAPLLILIRLSGWFVLISRRSMSE